MNEKELYELLRYKIQDQLSGEPDDVLAARQSWAVLLGDLYKVAPGTAATVEKELDDRRRRHKEWADFWRQQRAIRYEVKSRLKRYWDENPLSDLQPKLLQSSPQAGRKLESGINKI